MSVTSLSRWSGGTLEQIAANVKTATAIQQKLGAETVRVGQIYTGPHAGQYVVAVRYPNWESYGKAQQALASSAEYSKLHAKITSEGSRLESRTLIAGIDV
jgi:hypothetical protein